MTITLGRNFIFRKFRFSRFWVIRSSKILLEDMFSILDQSYSSYFTYTLSLPETSTINHQPWLKLTMNFHFWPLFQTSVLEELVWEFRPLFFGLITVTPRTVVLKKWRRKKSYRKSEAPKLSTLKLSQHYFGLWIYLTQRIVLHQTSFLSKVKINF